MGESKMRKIIALGIMLLFLGMTISSPAEESTLNGDLDITISAGYFGRDIGRGVTVDIVNNNINESVTVFVNLSFDFLFIDSRDTNTSWVEIIESKCWLHFGFGYGISIFSITVEGGNTTVTRDGIIIYKLLILFK